MLVADAVTAGGQAQACHAVHEAGCEPAQAAVAKRGIRLQRAQAVEIDAKACKRLARRLHEAEIGQRIEEQTTNKIFDGEIVDPFSLFGVGAAGRVQPAVNDLIPCRQRRRHKPIVIARTRSVLAGRIGQLFQDRRGELLDIRAPRRSWRGFVLVQCRLSSLGAPRLDPASLTQWPCSHNPQRRASGASSQIGCRRARFNAVDPTPRACE